MVDENSDQKKLIVGDDRGIPILGERDFEVRTLAAGARLRLRDGSVVEVIENPRDGIWVMCRGESGEVEPVWCHEFQALISDGSG